jgi:hypothetical protein
MFKKTGKTTTLGVSGSPQPTDNDKDTPKPGTSDKKKAKEDE